MGAECGLHPLIHILPPENLAPNVVDGQVKAVQKITPIDPMPMGVATEGVAIMKRATYSPHGFSDANPMPKKSRAEVPHVF